MIRKNSKTGTIYSRFFRNISGISISFMLLLLLCISILFYRQFMMQEAQASMRQLDYISGQLNYYLEAAQNYSKSIMVNADVQSSISKYGNQPGTEGLNATRQLILKDQIVRIIQSTAFIHSVTLYNMNLDMLVSTEPYPCATIFSPDEITAGGTWMSTTKSSFNSRGQLMEALSLIQTFYDYSTGSQLGYLEITIPEHVISGIYKEQVTDTSHIYLTDKNGILKSSDGSLPLSQKYPLFYDMISDSGYSLSPSAIIFYDYIPVLDWYVINDIRLLQFIAPTVFVFLVTLCIAFLCVLACLFVSHRVSLSITSPLDALIAHTRKIEKGTWTPLEMEAQEDKIGELLDAFNRMILSQEKLKNDLLEAQRLKDKASLDLLQQQVNPHFLYNTLDNICSLAELEEKDTLIDLVMNLSAFYHEGLSNGRFCITVQEELALTRAYLHIMQIRYYNKFNYTICCPDALLKSPCLKLLLQPVVENSIYHGIKELETMGSIDIRVFEEETHICITVSDNGAGLSPGILDSIFIDQQEHFGIYNIHQRIQLYYGTAYGLTIKNRPKGGCITTIQIGKEGFLDETTGNHRR